LRNYNNPVQYHYLLAQRTKSRDVSLHNFDGLSRSGLAFSVAPVMCDVGEWRHLATAGALLELQWTHVGLVVDN